VQIKESTTYQSYTLNIKGSFELEGDGKGGGLSEKLKEDIKKGEVSGKSISGAYLFEFNMKIASYAKESYTAQGSIFDTEEVKKLMKDLDLLKLGYEGKPIEELSADEAKALVDENGFFGVSKTAQRIADFVINGGGKDLDMLKAGRDGAAKGMKDAEAVWGGRLADISYKTLDKALELINKRIEELGANALDVEA